MSGLVLPHLTEADPGFAGEGSLDPLGLAPISDRLAEQIAPFVTARMTRIRFVTAIAVCASATQELTDIPPGDKVSTPWLVFEWHLTQGLAGARNLERSATRGVPGIQKARAAVARGVGLDARSYLQVPKVFGFHGFFKRLARSFGVVDDDMSLASEGDQLLRAWEQDQDLVGFADRSPGTEGTRLSQSIARAVEDAYRAGHVIEQPGSHLWGKLVRYLRPDQVGRAEAKLLRGWLTAPDQAIRRELVDRLRQRELPDSEHEAVRQVMRQASSDLRRRLEAIDAYEAISEMLEASFLTLTYISSSKTAPMASSEVADPLLRRVVKDLPNAVALASSKISNLDDPPTLLFEAVTAAFAQRMQMPEFIDALLERHHRVQAAKPPRGKAPWFITYPDGFRIRPEYATMEKPQIEGSYVHPYRIFAIRTFLSDLK